MATSNNDRISSRRLLDTLKGLQESRHLGSEPEVETETVEYPAVVSPAVGTYQSAEELQQTMLEEPDENRFPIKIYTTIAVPTEGTFPLTVNEPTGDYVEITKKVTLNGTNIYCQSDFPEDGNTDNYSGYFIGVNQAGNNLIWTGLHVVNGTGNLDVYQWEMPAKTETTTTKTKRTIKQDYLPNADWNVNDPDADGYVEGRTHWVEIGETEYGGTVAQLQGTGMAIATCEGFGAVSGFTHPTGEYKPNRVGEVVSEGSVEISYVGEDSSGNAITVSDIASAEAALSSTAVGILLLKSPNETSPMAYVWYPNVAVGDVINAAVVAEEIVHKIPNKYIDFPEIPENWKMDYDKPNGAQYSMNTGIGNGGGFPFLARVYCKLGERKTASDTSKKLLYFFNVSSSGSWVNETVSKYLNDMQIQLNELLSNENKTDVRVVIAYLANKTLLSVYDDGYGNLDTTEEYFPDEIELKPNGSFDVHYTSANDPSHTASLYSEARNSAEGTGIFISSSDIDFTEMTIAFGGYLNPMFFNQAPVESNVEYGIKIPDIQYDISFYNVKVAQNIIMRYDLFIGSRGFLLDRSTTDDKIFSGAINLPANILEKLFNTIGARGMKGIFKNSNPNFTDTLEYHFSSGVLTVERVYAVAPAASQIRDSCNLEYFTFDEAYYN